ncbi:MAG: selenocysteine-specific translation elongation factor [Thermodesulfobacteriota bacterium]
MKHVILGTAGHIDHGKTALVKALTGVDTDRLKVEKERGITTELGFTFLKLPSGIRLGIIDVPGHEKFVKHMVAGVWGIDLVALVVAADEGIKPQTREHLEICELLKVKKGLVIITKIDLVDQELIDLVKEEISELTKGTFLRESPVMAVSSYTGQGIPELITVLDRLSQEVEERPSDGLFRLPIDRVFVMKGFGTVVTGTVVSGNLSLGELIEILPSRLEGKVRNLQVYNQPVEKIVAGQRAAINLQGIEASGINRGEVLIRPRTFIPTTIIDVYIEHLPSTQRPLKNRTVQRFHIGTVLANASIQLLDKEELVPGEGGFAQIRLDRPVVALSQDRFVIRGSSLIQTIGGGVVLDPHPEKHKRFSQNVINDLILLRDGKKEEILRYHLNRAGMGGMGLEDLLRRVSISPIEMEKLLKEMAKKGELLFLDPERSKVIHHSHYKRLREMVLDQLKEFHQRAPLKSGIAREELRSKLPLEMDMKLYQMVLHNLIQMGEVVIEKDLLRLSKHSVSIMDEKGLVKRVEEAILKAGLQPPSPKELAEEWYEEEDSLQTVFDHLAHQETFIKIKSGIYLHQTNFNRLKEELINYLKIHQEITTAQFKEMTKVSRKYAIPLIEYFDQMKLTLRIGDKRRLRTFREG